MKTLFVSGTDTEVGKTWVACEILRELRSNGHRVGAWKPVCSGAIEQNGQLIWNDVQLLASAIGADATDPILIDRICSQRFVAPMAPNVAARLEGRNICDVDLAAGINLWQDYADLVLIEGAGGLLSPASDRMLVADLVLRLSSPLLLVTANRLGAIHQTLATVESARTRGLEVMAVILNHVTGDVDPFLREANEDELKRLLVDVPLLVVPYAGDTLPWSRHINLAQWFRPLDRDEPLGG